MADDGITVSGVGEVQAPPDIAVIAIGVEVTAPTVGEARDGAAMAGNAILAAMRESGVRDRDIRTVGLHLNPQYDYSRDSTPKIIGYQASNQLSVKVRAMDTVSGVIDGAVKAGGDAARLNGITFAIDDPSPLVAEARKKAVVDARLRAETYAAAAGVTVGAVLGIWEESAADPPVRPMMMMARAESLKMADTPIQPGETTVSASVTVRFGLGETQG